MRRRQSLFLHHGLLDRGTKARLKNSVHGEENDLLVLAVHRIGGHLLCLRNNRKGIGLFTGRKRIDIHRSGIPVAQIQPVARYRKGIIHNAGTDRGGNIPALPVHNLQNTASCAVRQADDRIPGAAAKSVM